MCGCERLESARASRSNRWRSSGFVVTSPETILMATERSRRVSRARYTSPIPPAPIGETISYGPSLAPGANGMSEDYMRRPLRKLARPQDLRGKQRELQSRRASPRSAQPGKDLLQRLWAH